MIHYYTPEPLEYGNLDEDDKGNLRAFLRGDGPPPPPSETINDDADGVNGIGMQYQFIRSMVEFTCFVCVLILVLVVFGVTLAKGQTISNALPALNAQRAARGLYPLLPAPDLQRQAEYESIVRAERRISGHLPGGCSPGRAEGVGMRSGADPYGRNFIACYTTTRRHRYAGAAAAVNRRGQSFYTLILR